MSLATTAAECTCGRTVATTRADQRALYRSGQPYWTRHDPTCPRYAVDLPGQASNPCEICRSPGRPYPCGPRCPQHTPARLAGQPEAPEPAGPPWWVRPAAGGDR